MSDKKKILLVSDDIRIATGVSIISKNMMKGTSDSFEWVQMGGLGNHPSDNKVSMYEGIKIYGAQGFGNAKSFRACVEMEKPDGILFFTDPNKFTHLFQEEYDMRKKIPWMYYNIWDNYPSPKFNKPYYESCDGLFCISKLTEEVVTDVLKNGEEDIAKDRVITYVPHGLDENLFKPMDRKSKKFKEKAISVLGFDPFDYQFIVLWSNKNTARKKSQDAMYAFDRFISRNNLYPHDALMIMNTNPMTNHGANLYESKYDLIENYNNIVFTDNGKFKDEEMPILYNVADIVINNSDNEGWGLAVTEAKLCGVPIMGTDTGGIKDQIRDDDGEFGEWAFPLEVDISSILGNPVAPYIYESEVDPEQIIKQLENAFFDYTYNDLKRIGKMGREHCIRKGHTNKIMCKRMKESIEKTLDNFTPRKRLKIKSFNG